MALEHALLISLREQPASGLELTRRFERSLGFFWHATHQQIYRTLARMEADGWLSVEHVSQHGKADKKVHTVTDVGARVLAEWLAAPSPVDPLRSELAVKLRGASYAADRAAVRATVADHLADHRTRLAHYERLARRDYPHPEKLAGKDLDDYLVLRGGLRLEQFWIDWLTECLEAHTDES